MSENAIIQVSTHGGIPLINGTRVSKFMLPENMTLVKLNVVSPGVCNYVSTEESHVARMNIKKRIRSITTFLEEIAEGDLDEDAIEYKKNRLIRMFRVNDVSERMSKMNTTDPEELEYKHNAHNKYSLSVFNNENPYLANKIFTRSNANYFGDFSETNTWDFKINWLNREGEPDLMTTLSRQRPTRTKTVNTVSLSDIMKHLNSVGVKNVFLFDFSCSEFINVHKDPLTRATVKNKTPISRRTTRSVRRSMKRLFGGETVNQK